MTNTTTTPPTPPCSVGDPTAGQALLAAALTAAARGWRVFPLRPGTKKPALHGDSPRRPCPRTGGCADGHQGWEQRATTDPDRIHAAWSRAPFNIGIATGPSGLLVIDLDTPTTVGGSVGTAEPEGGRGGWDTFTALCQTAGQPVPTDTYTVATPRRGSHLYFTQPPDVQLRSTRGQDGAGLGWKVDTRGWGGYIVAASSTTGHGTYTPTRDQTPQLLPAWLAARLTPTPPPTTPATPVVPTDRLPAYIAAALRGETHQVATAAPHTHTAVLFRCALALGQLVGAHHLPSGTAETELLHAAHHMITGPCGCTDREVRRTITNGLRRGINDPRTLPTTPRGWVA